MKVEKSCLTCKRSNCTIQLKCHGKNKWIPRDGEHVVGAVKEKGAKFDDGKPDYSLIPLNLMQDWLSYLGGDSFYIDIFSKIHNIINVETVISRSGRIKIQMERLMQKQGLESTSLALGFGCVKYDKDNWKEGFGGDWKRFLRATLRHLVAVCKGDEFDGEALDGFPYGNSHKGAVYFSMMVAYNEHMFAKTGSRVWSN